MKKDTSKNSKNKLTQFFEKESNEQSDLKRKQDVIRKHDTEVRFEEIERTKAESASLANISFAMQDCEKIEAMKKTNSEYFESARTAPLFLLPEFRYLVTPARKNVILAGAPTGAGKSSLCANAIYSFMSQGKRVLVVSNEELETDVFNRVTCLMKGWPYTKHSSFSDD